MAVLASNSRSVASNMARGSQFGMKLNAKSYNLMISGLYEEPVRAFVREMTSNMDDSHTLRNQMWHKRTASTSAMAQPTMSVYANKLRHESKNEPELIQRLETIAPVDKQYEVTLPSALEPLVVFQDFGVGMHISQILGEQAWDDEGNYLGRHGGTYTTLFDSTKDDSNDYTGALGLGSKTPFVITTTFTFSSTFNGLTHHYVATKDEDGLPTCMCVSEELDEDGESLNPDGVDEGVEFDGLRIEVPAPSHRWTEIVNHAEELYGIYEVPPIVRGDSSYQSRPIYRDNLIGNTYLQPSSYWRSKDHFVIMGTVAYPVNTNHLNVQVQQLLQHMDKSTYTIMPVGSLDFQPSRDGLNYNDSTKEALNVYYNSLVKGLKDHIAAQMLSAWNRRDRFGFFDVVADLRAQVGDALFDSLKFTRGDMVYNSKFKPMINVPTVTVSSTIDNVRYKPDDPLCEEPPMLTRSWEEPMAKYSTKEMTHDDQVIRSKMKVDLQSVVKYSTLQELDRDYVEGRPWVFYIRDTDKKWKRHLAAIVDQTEPYRLSELKPHAQFDEDVFIDSFGRYADRIVVVKLTDYEPMPTLRSARTGGGPRDEVPQVFKLSPQGNWLPMLKNEWRDLEDDDGLAEGAHFVDMVGMTSSVSVRTMLLAKRICNDTMPVYAIRRGGRKAIKMYSLVPFRTDLIQAAAEKVRDLPISLGVNKGLIAVRGRLREAVGPADHYTHGDAEITIPPTGATKEEEDLFEAVGCMSIEELTDLECALGIDSTHYLRDDRVRNLCPAHAMVETVTARATIKKKVVEVESFQLVGLDEFVTHEPVTVVGCRRGGDLVHMLNRVEMQTEIQLVTAMDVRGARFSLAEQGLAVPYDTLPSWNGLGVVPSVLPFICYDQHHSFQYGVVVRDKRGVTGARGMSSRYHTTSPQYFTDAPSWNHWSADEVWDNINNVRRRPSLNTQMYWTADINTKTCLVEYDLTQMRIEEAEVQRDIALVEAMYGEVEAEFKIPDLVEPEVELAAAASISR